MQFNSFVLLILAAVWVMGQLGTIRLDRLLAASRPSSRDAYDRELVQLDPPKEPRIELPSLMSDVRKQVRSESTKKTGAKVGGLVKGMSGFFPKGTEKKTDEKETDEKETDEKETGQIEGGPQDPQSPDVETFLGKLPQQARETVPATAGTENGIVNGLRVTRESSVSFESSLKILALLRPTFKPYMGYVP
ncbi:hypothetical protein GHT06_017477 [Daphnia sinensis]|uniref:Uncharacterized protein n=1 Tax=Daphnia sinensis TaxID=1820382 RepID=A0AAD5KQW2_9CRUS|nr:hypothetical protein GHT06_017477 [Daphnia sinensis]